jgi:hypothetical protein
VLQYIRDALDYGLSIMALGVSILALSLNHAEAVTSIDSNTSVGSSSLSQSLGFSTEPETNFDLNASYGFSNSKSTDSTTGVTISNDTHQVNGGMGWAGSSGISMAGDLSYSKTPDESLSSFGPRLSAGYTYRFESEGFRPTLGIKLDISSVRYTQTFSTDTSGRRGGGGGGPPRPVIGENAIRQSSAKISIKTRPISFAALKLSFKKYTYDKDVAQFLSFLDSQSAVRTNVSTFSSAVSGLPESDSSVSFILYPIEDWNLTFGATSSISALDQSKGQTYLAEIEHDFTDLFNVGLGTQRTVSSGSTSNSYFLSLSLDFE